MKSQVLSDGLSFLLKAPIPIKLLFILILINENKNEDIIINIFLILNNIIKIYIKINYKNYLF